MFEKIDFITYTVPNPSTTFQLEETRSQLTTPDTLAPHFAHTKKMLQKARHLDFRISGTIQTFPSPPPSDFATASLYHMESFSIFLCDQAFFTKRSHYQSYLILYTYDGCGLLTYEGQTYSLTPGTGFFIDCQKPHFYKTLGPTWHHSVLHLNGPLLNTLHTLFIQRDSALFHDPFDGPYQAQLEALLHCYDLPLPHREWTVSNCLSNLLTYLLSKDPTTPQPPSPLSSELHALSRYIEKHFTQDLSLDYLAHFSGISKYHLSREFKRYTGYAPNDYIIRLRIKHAKSLLLSTTLPINQIAFAVGFKDANNFNNLFKKHVTLTPGQYRKQNRFIATAPSSHA